MKRIGLISDTHGTFDPRFAHHFATCDEIWHAGDIGTLEVAERLAEIAPLRAVRGNIDGGELRMAFPETLRFRCEEVDVLLKHIGGYPGHYDRSLRTTLLTHPPQLLVCGHSHILRVARDPQYHLLHLNPGAAGHYGHHLVRTLLRFCITGERIHDVEVIELAEGDD